MEDPWSVDPTEGNIGPAVYKTGSYGDDLCSALVTPDLHLLSGSVLTFASKFGLENGWDKGELQISTDGGSIWERVEMGYPGNSNQAADACGLPAGTYFTGTDTTYNFYNADLSNWDNQVVKLRFILSTDNGGGGDGWWIDDLRVTNADVPGNCTTGSACEDNPFVDVVPEGPITTCEGQSEMLTAELTGGNGPFFYQWTRDGIDIAGADSSTYVANDVGTHLYNARVKAETCSDEATDGNFTEITWQGAPDFDGVDSATNAILPICTVDLAWDPASTVCPGPITYSVYRSTTSPVPVTPANRIASDLTDTTYSDAIGLDTGTTYYYVVRAVDSSNGQEDTNTVEASATPTSAFGLTCVTGQASPPSVPDGQGATSPLMGSRATVAGDVIDVSWDAASCPALAYNLLYGDLANVSAYALSGARCSVGTTGNYTWSGVPVGDLYFLIVGANGVGAESSWGTDSDLNERNGAAASGFCLVSTKNTDVICP
jgi:hypothetical protein